MKDSLAREIYAQKIADEIKERYESEKEEFLKKNKQVRENTVFAISGKWGEGKTALLDLLEPALRKYGFKIARFNPWKYSQEDITLKRAFLGSLKEQVASPVNLEDLYFDRTRTNLNFDWPLVLKVALVSSFLYFFIPASMGFLFEWLNFVAKSFEWVLSLPLIKPLITLILIPVVLELVTISRRGANVSTAEEFERKFEELLIGTEKLVIFIDDLDRCNPKTVKTILDSLRTFFQHPECSYIITGDHTVVERYAGDELGLSKEIPAPKKLQEGRRFLKKLFDVYWRLPLPTPHQFGIFVDEEISSSKLALTESQLQNLKSFLTDDDLFERNPRHVKRFITKLRFAIEGVSLQKQSLESATSPEAKESVEALDDILKNPDLLGKVLLFEELLYPAYEKLIVHPEELINHEKLLRANTDLSQLKVGLKTLGTILFDQQDEIEKYASIVRKAPKFTDEDNSTLHEVANYLSFSGSTGLPSVLGPDESKFVEYLKSGQLEAKLGAVLEVSTKGKRDSFAQRALIIFDEQSDDAQKSLVMGEALKLAKRLEEWTRRLSAWKEKLFSLPPEIQKSLLPIFWAAVLEKNPVLLSSIKTWTQEQTESFWDFLESVEYSTFDSTANMVIENFLKGYIVPSSPSFRGAEAYLKKSGSKSLETSIEEQIKAPSDTQTYLNNLKAGNFANGTIATIVKKHLKDFVGDFTHFEWFVSRIDYLKEYEFFIYFKDKIRSWSKDITKLEPILAQRGSLDLDDGDLRNIASNVIARIPKSSSLEFLSNQNVQSILNKEEKKRTFEALQFVVVRSDEAIEKRKNAAQILQKSNSLWNDLTIDDVYEFLRSVKSTKFGKALELKKEVESTLTTWGYDDGSEEKVKDDEPTS